MKPLTVFEFDRLVNAEDGGGARAVPGRVFRWLESQCLDERLNVGSWLKLSRVQGRRAIQVTGHVGVLRAPCGFQIEVLPKIGRHVAEHQARALLISMLQSLQGFRHIRSADASLGAAHMPLLEVFIQQFLEAVANVVRRGLRRDYVAHRDDLYALRGKLVVGRHVSRNLLRRERFFVEYDEFSVNRTENRLLASALRQVLRLTGSQENQRLGRELGFVFADVPPSVDVVSDSRAVRLDRGMAYYEPALMWSRLILLGLSPNSTAGAHVAASLLFPMDALFEAYVAKYLQRQLQPGFSLKTQTTREYLVGHRGWRWFQLRPDLLVQNRAGSVLVLDTKWKLLDASLDNGREKYGLSQADFYQLYAYGHQYLDGQGDAVLIYPRTEAFDRPLFRFEFSGADGLNLWVLPFCLKERTLVLPEAESFNEVFRAGENGH